MKIHSLTKNFSNLMKKVNFKKVLMALATVFTLMVFSVEQAEAQAINEFSTGLYDPAPGAFVSSTDAEGLLESEFITLGDVLQNVTPGTPVHTVTLRTAHYYRGIYMELQNGKSVSAAIGTGLSNLNDLNGFGDLTRAQLADLRQTAIELLQ